MRQEPPLLVGEEGRWGRVGYTTLLGLVVPHGLQECVIVAPKPDLLDDVRRPVLQLDRLSLQDLEVGPFLARLLQVFLEARDLLPEGLALLAALAEDVLDATHLLGVEEPLLEGNRFDAIQGVTRRAFHVLHQRSGRLLPVGPTVVIPVAVLLFAGVRVLRAAIRRVSIRRSWR